DPDDGDVDRMTYELVGGVPAGFDAGIDGKTLKASAKDGTAAGATGAVQVKAKDPRGLEATATYQLTATASNRPKPVANDDLEPNAAAGKPVTVRVLDNDANPFPETALKIVSAVTETGQGSAAVTGDTVTVTPADGFSGTMIVAYTVADKTGESSRNATARIRLTVKDKPLAPTTPQAASVGDGTALLNWTAPADRGSAITKYTVSGEGGYSQDCPANSCTLTGLTNNTKYHFQVTATNALGTSERSPASAEVRPDVKPDTPAAPAVKFGDTQLTVAWAAPASKGSPVKSYDLEISPAPAGQNAQIQNLTSVNYVWKGLKNGVAYKVRVLARNDAKEPSEWSGYSASETPAGVPVTPAAPSASQAGSVGSQTQLKVNWTAPNNNGDAVSAYTLTTLNGGAAVATQQVSGTMQNVTVNNSEANYTFTVSATNKAGTSGTSAQSAAVRAVGKPAMVGQPSATLVDTGGDGGKIDVRFAALTAEQRNGSSAGEITYKYKLTSGSGSGNIPAGGGVVAAPNGTATAVVVWAVSSRSSSTGDGSPASASVNPYGLAFAPAVTGAKSSGVGDKTVSWTWNAPNGNGRPVTGYQYRLDGAGGWQDTQQRSFSKGVGFSETHTLEVRAISGGQNGRIGQDTSRSGSEPPPPVPVSQIQAHNSTCPGKPNQTDTYSPSGPSCGAGWVERTEGKLNVNCTKDIYGNGTPWYRVTEGSHPGWFVKSTTVDLFGPRPGGC
ncbi:MAG: fibronectin type III domain-containing protein, partial [Arthrobacter sp.]